MNKLKKIIAIGMTLLITVGLAACGSSEKKAASGKESGVTVQSIKDRGVLRVGCKDSVVGFGYLNNKTSQYEGLEIDLAKKIAKELGVDIKFTPVTATTRGQLIDSGDIDMVAATFTITDERKKSYDFTTPYYVDANAVMVTKASGIKTLVDLKGKTIGVTTGSTNKASLQKATSVNMNFEEYSDYSEIKLALKAGTVDGFCVDTSILSSYLDDDCMILDERFSPQKYGIATKKDSEFSGYSEDLVTKWLKDGTVDQMLKDNKIQPSFKE